MARKNARNSGSAEVFVFDQRTKTVMASSSASTHDAIREKVQAVREVVPGRSNNELILVLQYYDYNVEHTIQAFLEDGAKEALEEWHVTSGPNKVTSKKKKKSKNKAKDFSSAANTGPDSSIPYNSTLHDHISQNGHITSDINSNSVVKPYANGHVDTDPLSTVGASYSLPPSTTALSTASLLPNGSDALLLSPDHPLQLHPASESQASSCSTMSSPSTLSSSSSHTVSPSQRAVLPLTKDTKTNSSVSSLSDVTLTSNDSHPLLMASSLLSVSSNNVDPSSTRLPMEPSSDSTKLTKQQSSGKGKPHSRPKTLEVSNKSNRERNSSAASSTSVSSLAKGKGLEKSVKDLHRQATSLQRIKILLNDEVERSFKDITQTFEKLHHVLNEREAELMFSMDKMKNQAQTVILQRQTKAAELKQRTECHQPENQLSELRADVKQFVSERKIDEDLGSTKRFVTDLDKMLASLQEFGTVVPVKASYSLRRLSTSSLTSSVFSPEDLQSPFSPAASANSATLHAATTEAPLSTAQSVMPPSAVTAAQLTGAKVVSQSDSVTRYEVTELQNRLAGVNISEKPKGNSRTIAQRRNQNQRPVIQSQKPQPSEDNDQYGDGKKSRNARRRQKQRERQKEQKRTLSGEENESNQDEKTEPDSKRDAAPDTQGEQQNRNNAQGIKRQVQNNRRTPSPRKTLPADDIPIRTDGKPGPVQSERSTEGKSGVALTENGDHDANKRNGPKNNAGPRPDSGNRNRNRNQRSRSLSAGGKQGQGNMKAVTVSVKEKIVEDGVVVPVVEAEKRTVEMTNASGVKTATVKVDKLEEHADIDGPEGLPQRKVRSRRRPKENENIASNGVMTNGIANGEMSDSH